MQKNLIENTQNADMHLAQEKFLQLLPCSVSILVVVPVVIQNISLRRDTRWRQLTDLQNSVDRQAALQGLK